MRLASILSEEADTSRGVSDDMWSLGAQVYAEARPLTLQQRAEISKVCAASGLLAGLLDETLTEADQAVCPPGGQLCVKSMVLEMGLRVVDQEIPDGIDMTTTAS